MSIKSVKLSEVQFEYFDFYCINFSSWVRMKIDEDMKQSGFYKIFEKREKRKNEILPYPKG